MSPRRELCAFAAALGALLAGLFAESLFGGKVLSPADVVYASASFRALKPAGYEPANRLLIDPVLQFQPWLEFNRTSLRQGKLPLWNELAGCGAPHLANGQSAVFDPFHVIAYLGTLPDVYAWMAWARLWVAGLGIFLLTRSWCLGAWGRWFAGLAFPFCGFLIVWLQFPVTSVAVWLPWLLWANGLVLSRPAPRSVAMMGLFVGLVLLGGHIQTSAHVLLLAGLDFLWRLRTRQTAPRGAAAWAGGVVLGLALGAVAIVPLGFYLAESPVWGDRAHAQPPVWQLERPRVLDMVCTALPYAFGSQRTGQPNLARALGVHNLNESAGGFAGLATLVWLAPLAWSARRKQPRAQFLFYIAALSALGAFRWPPVDNLLRAMPVLGVTDNRRLTLWLAFSLVVLGGIGLDRLGALRRGQAARTWAFVTLLAAIGLLAAASSLRFAEPWLGAHAREHYAKAASETPGATASDYRGRADRQVAQTLTFVPRYLTMTAAQLAALAALVLALRRGRITLTAARAGFIAITLADLFGFAWGLNPAIDPADNRPLAPVIASLKREVGEEGRVLGVGAEMPPNLLMRYGLADVRNYDSVELGRNLSFFERLYEPDRRAHTSRREVTWAGVIRALDRLREARVRAVVAATPPPRGVFERVEQVGEVWVAFLDAPRGLASSSSGRGHLSTQHEPGAIRVENSSGSSERVIVSQTYDHGWKATVDGAAAPVVAHRGTFLAVDVGPGTHTIALRYAPAEVYAALWISTASLIAIALVFFLPRDFVQKNAQSAWTPLDDRVTIDLVISTGRPNRFSEG